MVLRNKYSTPQTSHVPRQIRDAWNHETDVFTEKASVVIQCKSRDYKFLS